jgi:hypothetical protein
MIVEVTGPSRRSTPARPPGMAGEPCSDGQEQLRRAARDLLQELGSVPGPDEPGTRQMLSEVAGL